MGKLRDRVRLQPGLIYDRHPYGKAPGRDPDLLVRGLEPSSPLEADGMAALSPVDLEVFHNKMTSIVEEGRDVYQALSISEGTMTGDMTTSIFTPEGDPAAVATGIYFHTVLNYAPVKYIMTYRISRRNSGRAAPAGAGPDGDPRPRESRAAADRTGCRKRAWQI